MSDGPSPHGGTVGIGPSSEALISDRRVGCPGENAALQVSSSQDEDGDDFGGGAWAAMKAEMGLDERNPSCFLHSYSVVMVLRKVICRNPNPRHAFDSGRIISSWGAGPLLCRSGHFLRLSPHYNAPLDVFWYRKTKWWRCTGGDL